MKVDQVVYLTEEQTEKTPKEIFLDLLNFINHAVGDMLTHVDIE